MYHPTDLKWLLTVRCHRMRASARAWIAAFLVVAGTLAQVSLSIFLAFLKLATTFARACASAVSAFLDLAGAFGQACVPVISVFLSLAGTGARAFATAISTLSELAGRFARGCVSALSSVAGVFARASVSAVAMLSELAGTVVRSCVSALSSVAGVFARASVSAVATLSELAGTVARGCVSALSSLAGVFARASVSALVTFWDLVGALARASVAAVVASLNLVGAFAQACALAALALSNLAEISARACISGVWRLFDLAGASLRTCVSAFSAVLDWAGIWAWACVSMVWVLANLAGLWAAALLRHTAQSTARLARSAVSWLERCAGRHGAIALARSRPLIGVRTRLWLAELPYRLGWSANWPPVTTPKHRLEVPLVSPALSVIAVVCGPLVVWAVTTFPSPGQLYPLSATLEPRVDRQLILYDDEGRIFARRGGCVDRPVRLKELPRHLIDAVLATEDRRFYYHIGLDPKGILRAALNNYRADRIVEGGSTITQQLAKVTYLSSEKSYRRKVREALIVLRLELMLSKDEILERYLSAAYFGESCHGVRAAARHYFRKSVGDLTLSESALLVALLRAPTRLSRSRDKAWSRHHLVLQSMVRDGRLDPERIATLERAEIVEPANAFGAYYADWIAHHVDVTGVDDSTPLKVRTNFNLKLQGIANKAVAEILKRSAKGRYASQAALVAMRTDGRVVAMVGGRNYHDSQFNRAVQALRQPGSSFKTFVYLAALRAGARPGTYTTDSPIRIGDWSPQNYGRKYRGRVTLRRAFASSINTVAVRLSESIGRQRVIKAARDLGISTPMTPTPSIALGASEVNLLEMTAAYAAIAANAYPVRPWGVVALGNDDREARPPSGSGKWRLLVGDNMRDLLETTVSRGTGRGARLRIPAYGKTGTSQEFRDAWFVGFAGNLVVGVWVGNDDNSPMRRVTGGSLPAQIWQRFMRDAQRQDAEFTARLPNVPAFRSMVHGDQEQRLISSKNAFIEGGSLVTPGKRRRVVGYRYRPRANRKARTVRHKSQRSASRSRRSVSTRPRLRTRFLFWGLR